MASLVTAGTPPDLDPSIWPKVRDAFAEALGLDDDEVELDATVIEDLGAESLDFLDIAFRLERAFDIKIPRGGIENAAKAEVGDAPYEVDGILTEVALAGLKEAMPEIDPSNFSPGLRTNEVADLFTVATFYNLVLRLLDAKAKGAELAG